VYSSDLETHISDSYNDTIANILHLMIIYVKGDY